jgi:cell division protein FtsB
LAEIASGLRKLRLPDLGRWAQIVVLLLLLGLLVAMALGPITRLIEQRQRMSQLSQELEEVQRNNDLLAERIGRLGDPDYIEQRAREQGGLVHPGEISIVVMPPGSTRRASETEDRRARRAQAPVAEEPEPGLLDEFVEFLGF